MTSVHDRAGQDRGAVIPLVALALPVLILMTAFAVDLGRQRDSARTMQASADVIALDLIRVADGRSAADLDADPATEAALMASLQRNGVDRARVVDVEWGTYELILLDPETWAFRSHRNGPSYDPGVDEPVNAVRVTTFETTDYLFQPGSGDVTRSAVATRDDLASVTLGSTLVAASIGDSAVLNRVLTRLLCPRRPADPPLSLCPGDREVDISAAGYDGLARANVTLDELRAAGGFGSVDELLDAEMSMADMAELFAEALDRRGDSSAGIFAGNPDSLASFAAELDAQQDTAITMRDVLSVESPTPSSAAGAEINPFDVFFAGAQVINGDNFVDLDVVVPPITVPGVANVEVRSRYQIIEAPRAGIGRVGSPAMRPPNLRTAQLRIFHEVSFDLNLSVAGTGVSGRVTLPINLAGGGADAELLAIDCAFPAEDTSIDVLAIPRTFTGTVGSSSVPAGQVTVTVAAVPPLIPGITIPLVNLTLAGIVDADAQNSTAQILEQIFIGVTESASGNNLGLGGSINTASLQVATVDLTPLNGLVRNTVNTLLGQLDPALRRPLNALGVSVTRADVTNRDATCEGVKLVG